MAKEKVQIRKAPKFTAFMYLFAAIGFVLAVVLNFTVVKSPQFFGYLLGYLTVLGGIVGLITALILDNISRSKSKTAEAKRSR